MQTNWFKKTGYVGALSLTLCGGILATAIYSADSVSANSTEQVEKVSEKSVDVSTSAEFVSALKDGTVTNISIKANFSLDSSALNIPARNVTIDGNGHQLNFGARYISGASGTKATLLVSNLSVTSENSLFTASLDNWTLHANNVTFQGTRFVKMPNGKLIVSGTNDVSTKAENGWVRHVEFLENSTYNSVAANEGASYSAFYFNGTDVNGTVNINKNAKVNVNLSPDGKNIYPVFYDKIAQVNIKDGGSLDIETPGKAFKFSSYNFEKTSGINITNNSSLKVNSSGLSTDEVIEYNDPGAELNVSNNSNIDIQGNTKNLMTTYRDSSVNISDSSYNFMNSKADSHIFDAKDTIFSLNGVSLNTWTKTGGNYEREPDESYDKLNLQSILSGNDSKLTTSTNPEAQKNFQMSNYGRISGEFEKENHIETPILNVVNDKDTQLTGFGTSGATVNIYSDGQLLGSTVVDADGRWTLSLETPLKEGTKVEASQVINGEESEKVSQIVSHLSSDTVNFFKYGYLQSYGLILEGSIDNGDLDLSNKDAVKKTINLVNENGDIVQSSEVANTDWYNPGVFNGYQAMLTNEMLATVKEGSYKLTVTLTVGDFTETQDLNVNNARYVGHTIFDQIEALNTGTNTVKTVNKGGIGYLTITNN